MGYDPNEPRDAEGKWTDAGNAIRTAASDNNKTKPVKVYTAEEIRDMDFVIAGQTLSIHKAMDLKVYAGNSAYINNKKVTLSDEDLNVIDNAKQIYFLYNSEGKAYQDGDSFSTSRFGHGSYKPKDLEDFKSILLKNGIKIE